MFMNSSWSSHREERPLIVMDSQQTKDVETMLGSSWPTVYDAGPILIQHWSCACCVMTDMVIDKKVYFAIKLLFTGKCVGDMYI